MININSKLYEFIERCILDQKFRINKELLDPNNCQHIDCILSKYSDREEWRCIDCKSIFKNDPRSEEVKQIIKHIHNYYKIKKETVDLLNVVCC